MARLIRCLVAIVALIGVAACHSHRVCVQWGDAIGFDVTADESQTVLKRYDMSKNPPELIDSHSYGPLPKPDKVDAVWDAGIDFVKHMQLKGCWAYPLQCHTISAHWDMKSESDDRWRFEASLNGLSIDVTLTTANCVNMPETTCAPTTMAPVPPPAQETTNPPATAPPVTYMPPATAPSETTCAPTTSAPVPPPAQETTNPPATAPPVTYMPPATAPADDESHHLCVQWGLSDVGSVGFDITADHSQTVLKRYDMSKNPPELIDTNTYGPLPKPDTVDAVWDAGVAFANAMSLKGCWAYTAQCHTVSAQWDMNGKSEDRWRFVASLDGHSIDLTFTTANCANMHWTGAGAPEANPTDAAQPGPTQTNYPSVPDWAHASAASPVALSAAGAVAVLSALLAWA